MGSSTGQAIRVAMAGTLAVLHFVVIVSQLERPPGKPCIVGFRLLKIQKSLMVCDNGEGPPRDVVVKFLHPIYHSQQLTLRAAIPRFSGGTGLAGIRNWM